jgi:hypothetical protein
MPQAMAEPALVAELRYEYGTIAFSVYLLAAFWQQFGPPLLRGLLLIPSWFDEPEAFVQWTQEATRRVAEHPLLTAVETGTWALALGFALARRPLRLQGRRRVYETYKRGHLKFALRRQEVVLMVLLAAAALTFHFYSSVIFLFVLAFVSRRPFFFDSWLRDSVLPGQGQRRYRAQIFHVYRLSFLLSCWWLPSLRPAALGQLVLAAAIVVPLLVPAILAISAPRSSLEKRGKLLGLSFAVSHGGALALQLASPSSNPLAASLSTALEGTDWPFLQSIAGYGPVLLYGCLAASGAGRLFAGIVPVGFEPAEPLAQLVVRKKRTLGVWLVVRCVVLGTLFLAIPRLNPDRDLALFAGLWITFILVCFIADQILVERELTGLGQLISQKDGRSNLSREQGREAVREIFRWSIAARLLAVFVLYGLIAAKAGLYGALITVVFFVAECFVALDVLTLEATLSRELLGLDLVRPVRSPLHRALLDSDRFDRALPLERFEAAAGIPLFGLKYFVRRGQLLAEGALAAVDQRGSRPRRVLNPAPYGGSWRRLASHALAQGDLRDATSVARFVLAASRFQAGRAAAIGVLAGVTLAMVWLAEVAWSLLSNQPALPPELPLLLACWIPLFSIAVTFLYGAGVTWLIASRRLPPQGPFGPSSRIALIETPRVLYQGIPARCRVELAAAVKTPTTIYVRSASTLLGVSPVLVAPSFPRAARLDLQPGSQGATFWVNGRAGLLTELYGPRLLFAVDPAKPGERGKPLVSSARIPVRR